MSNEARYRNGPRTLVPVPVASETVIDIGDFICLSGGNAVPPTVLQAAGSEAATAAAAKDGVKDVFLGIAENASANGETDEILVDISLESIYEYPQTAAAAISFGDLIEVNALSTASISYACEDQVIVAGATDPIAVCVKAHTSAQGTGTRIKLLPQAVINKVVAAD